MDNTVLAFEDVRKEYQSETALQDFNLSLQEGEIVTLIGPSGCGKTTCLRLAAGLEKPDDGRIILRNKPVSSESRFVPPEKRKVGFIFQDLALFPHLTVQENVAFGLSDGADDHRQERLEDVFDLVGLNQLRDRNMNELSGGQRQRVALARSLVVRPSVLLMDEPFSNLDKELRNRLRRDVREILKESGIPTIFVTHDQNEALFLGDRMAVMREGSIQQVGVPENVVVHPKNRFVGEFLGPTEFIPARKSNGSVKTEFDTLPREDVNHIPGEEFELMVRGDDVTIEPTENGNSDGIIADAEFLGGFFRYTVKLDSGRHIHSLLNHSERIPHGTPVEVQLDPGHELTGFSD